MIDVLKHKKNDVILRQQRMYGSGAHCSRCRFPRRRGRENTKRKKGVALRGGRGSNFFENSSLIDDAFNVVMFVHDDRHSKIFCIVMHYVFTIKML